MTLLPTILGMTQVAIGPLLVLFAAGVVVLLVAAGFIFLFIKYSHKGRWILAGLLCTIVLAPIILLVGAITLPYISRARMMHAGGRQMSISQTWNGGDGQLTSQSIQYHSGGGVPVAQTTGRATKTGVSFVVLPIALLFLCLLAVLLVVLFIKSGRRGRIVIGSLVAVVFAFLGVAVAGLFFVRSQSVVAYRVVPSHTFDEPGTPEQQRVANEQFADTLKAFDENRDYFLGCQTTASRPSSQPLVGSVVKSRDLAAAGFEPDVYASKESAVRSVARLAAQQYKALITLPDQMPKSLQIAYSESLIRGESTNAGSAFGHIALQELQKIFGQSLSAYIDLCTKPPVPERPGYDDALLYLSLEREPQSAGETEETGRVQGIMSGPVGRITQYAEYVNKPWQEDFHRWRRRAQDAASWVFGESEDFCASRQESIDRAIQAAIPGIRGPLSREVNDVFHRGAGWLGFQADLYQWVDEEASRRLKIGDLQTDVFTQEFKRPYGSVWRSAVLVHIPRDTARSILNAYRVQTEARRTTWLHTLLSGAGLFAVILAVYLFLNMATRGYYVWSVRLATVVLAAVGTWCILTFVR